MIRAGVLTANTFAAVFFAAFFVYTFFGRAHVDSLARDYLTAKTVEHVDPLVDHTDELLRKAAGAKIAAGQWKGWIDAARKEITAYRQDPHAYVSQVTRREGGIPAKPKAFAKNNPIVAKVAEWKRAIRDYFEWALGQLFRDLRIFAASSCLAAVVAVWLAWRGAASRPNRHVWFAFLLLASVAFSVYMYIDSFSFFRILLGAHLGWAHPVFLLLFCACLHFDLHDLYERWQRSHEIRTSQ